MGGRRGPTLSSWSLNSALPPAKCLTWLGLSFSLITGDGTIVLTRHTESSGYRQTGFTYSVTLGLMMEPVG